jgi:hypothetical protein
MLVGAVACVDDWHVGYRGRARHGADVGVAHDDDVDVLLQDADRVLDSLALLDRGELCVNRQNFATCK